MNLTLHIVRKDLRRLRWWLVAWIVVLLLPIAIGVRLLVNNPFEQPWVASSSTLERVQALAVLFGYLLTVFLLQEDRAIGTQQFWLTRPISRGRLLRAKALGVFIVLCWVPVIVSLPWWFWCRLGPAQIAVAALELMVIGALVALPGMLLGTLTETLSRAALWTAVLLPAVGTTMGFFALQHHGRMDRTIYAAVIATTLVAVEIIVVVLWVFLSRRRTWRLLFAAAGFPVLVAVSFALGARWAERKVVPRELNAAARADIAVKFKHARALIPQNSSDGPEKLQAVSVAFSLERVPSGVGVALAEGSRHEWRWNGLALERPASQPWQPMIWWPLPLLGLRQPEPDPETEAWMQERRHLRGLSPPLAGRADGTDFSIVEQFKRSLVARMETEPPGYRAELWFESLRPEMLFQMPLAVGEMASHSGYYVRIAQSTMRTDPRDHARSVVLAQTTRQSLTQTLHHMAHPDKWPREFWAGPAFFAINLTRREAVPWSPDGESALLVNGVRVAWRTYRLDPGRVRRGDKWVHRPGWNEGLSLVLVRLNTEALFKREIVVEKLMVEPPPRLSR